MSKFIEYLEQSSSSTMKNAYKIGEKEMEKKAPSKSTLYKREQEKLNNEKKAYLKEINNLNEDLNIKLDTNYGFKDSSKEVQLFKTLIEDYKKIIGILKK